MIYSASYSSPVGILTLCSDGGALVGLWREGQKYYGAGFGDGMTGRDDLPLFAAAKSWLDRYFNREKPSPPELPLAPVGSDFRKAVWGLLTEIPYGETTTYGAIAKRAAVRLGKESMSGQAVGGAVGHNPISIIIPCHRVVGADGSLTGYAGGLPMKQSLLALEGAELSRLFVPKRGTAL